MWSECRKLERGQSIIEVVVVAFFVMTALVTLASLTTISISRNRVAKERAVATRMAQEAMEWIKFERDRLGFLVISSRPPATYCLDILPDPTIDGFLSLTSGACSSTRVITASGVNFTRSLRITNVTADTVDFISEVTWQTGTTPTTISLKGQLTQWAR